MDQLIGMTAYSLIKYPIEDIKWFFDQLVAAGGNATEALFITTWDDTWEWQPYTIKKWETKMWRDKPWNTGGPGYAFPVFGLGSWNAEVWAKWRTIFKYAATLGLTLIIRVLDFCSRKDNFLERHWCYWSCVQSWRWGGRMSGGYLHWPPGDGGGGKYIWPHYDKLNKRLIAELKASGVEYYLEDWNELDWTPGSQVPDGAPAPDVYQNEVHRWFIENFKSHGCPADHVICDSQRGERDSATYRFQVQHRLSLGAVVEHHGCASPKAMREIVSLFGGGRKSFPNGDGMDANAKGINDGRRYYTEPSFGQAVTMGRLIRENNLFAYLFKGRTFRKSQTLRSADFTAVKGLAKGLSGS